MIIAIILWLIAAGFVAAGAARRRRSGAGWFLLSIVISPLLAGFGLVMLGPIQITTQELLEQRAYRRGLGFFLGAPMLVIVALSYMVKVTHTGSSATAEHERLSVVEPERIIVPEPDPTAAGQLAERDALSRVKLTPLN